MSTTCPCSDICLQISQVFLYVFVIVFGWVWINIAIVLVEYTFYRITPAFTDSAVEAPKRLRATAEGVERKPKVPHLELLLDIVSDVQQSLLDDQLLLSASSLLSEELLIDCYESVWERFIDDTVIIVERTALPIPD